MIMIAQEHYQKMFKLIQSLNRNMILQNPSNQDLKQLFAEWSSINSFLKELYKKLEMNLEQIVGRNSQLSNQNAELNNKLQSQRSENSNLIQANTMQRAQLAKNQAELNRYKEGVKKLKQTHREKMLEKDEVIAELERKVKKYKKLSQEQQKKFEKLDKKITQITQYEIAQRSSMKQQELDQQLLQLENMCKDLDEDLEHPPREFQTGSDTDN